jgi:transcriptional regulator with XRE-family HTH domain
VQPKEELLILCENLRRLRREYGFSKREMAEILGIGVASLTLLEQDRIPPRLSCAVLFRASRYFRIRAHELFQPME